MLSLAWPAVIIPVWQMLVSGDAALSEGVTKPWATVSHPSVLTARLSGRCENTESCCFPSLLCSFPPPPPPSPPSASPPPLKLDTGRQAGWLAAADEWGVFSQRCQSVPPLGHPEPVRSCGRTPPCLPIYPHTSNSEGPHHRHGVIKLSHYYCYCYLVIAYAPGM